jgi:hypothetical protein
MFAREAPWQNPRVLSTLLIVFLCGAAAGALTMRLGLHDKMHRAMPSWKQGNKEVFLSKFKTELNLNGDQAQQVALILEDYGRYYQSLQDQLTDLRSTGKTRIMDVLNSEQRLKFEKMLADLAPQ